MKLTIIVSLLSLSHCAPQYDGPPLDSGTMETIGDIFGKTSTSTGYGSVDESETVVQERDTYQEPDDYVEHTPVGNLTDKATTVVDRTFDNCGDYTKTLGYECVPYYQCHNGTIITDGAGLIDIRNGFGVLTPEDSKCPGFLDVCCKDPDFIPPPPPKLKYAPKCGRRNKNGLGVRIQGFKESESQFGEWPHMCAVLHETVVEDQQQDTTYLEPNLVNLFQCGASLIAPGVILTAAHCVDRFRGKAAELKIRCGEWDTQNETEPYPHQDRRVQDITIHPLFDPRTLTSDWALIFTAEDFVLSSHIDTACLPQANEVFDGTTCFATGWGKDKFGSTGEYQVVLKEIDLPVVEQESCQDKLRQTRLGNKFKLHKSFICAGGDEGKDTCKGDGGSPLVCPSKSNPNSYVQAGIVAWGIGCGENGSPGVYASVSKAVCWIDHAMTCYFGAVSGDHSSLNGYRSDICQAELDSLVVELKTKADAAGKYGRIFQDQITKIRQCSVAWEAPLAPKVSNVQINSNEDLTENGDESFTTENQYTGSSPVEILDGSYTAESQQTQDIKGSNLNDISSLEEIETSTDVSSNVIDDIGPIYK